jgi:hypothetical protein
MWIYTKYGTYSIVAKNDKWQIRSRVRDYMIDLMEAVGIEENLIHTPNRDYEFRIIVDRETYVQIYTHLMDAITYPDFKTHLKHTGFMDDEVNDDVYTGAYNSYWDSTLPSQAQEVSSLFR